MSMISNENLGRHGSIKSRQYQPI